VLGEVAILHADDSRACAFRLAAELAAEGYSVRRREAGAAATDSVVADAVIVVWSKAMLAAQSMIAAARQALARRVLAPVRIGGVDPPPNFAHLWPIDLDGWGGEKDDPRWQFVRDEIELAMRRSALRAEQPQVVGPGRPPPKAKPQASKRDWNRLRIPVWAIAPCAAALSIVVSAGVLMSAPPARVQAAGEAPARKATNEPPTAAVQTATLSVSESLAFDGNRAAARDDPSPPVLTLATAVAAFPEAGGQTIISPGTADVGVGSETSPEPAAETASESAALVEATPPLPPPPRDTFAGVIFRDCVQCPDMAEIPGSANIGSAPGFALSRREITFEQWGACVADGGCRAYRPSDSGFGREGRPAINVSWEDAAAYAVWLSSKTGRAYRLPTTDEWAHAAHAGAETPPAPLPDRANFDAAPWKSPLPAGSFAASTYGLYDMQGNVWEWTADCSDADQTESDCSSRIAIGGGYDAPAGALAGLARVSKQASERRANTGFRVARDL